jgi:hypothetical protein
MIRARYVTVLSLSDAFVALGRLNAHAGSKILGPRSLLSAHFRRGGCANQPTQKHMKNRISILTAAAVACAFPAWAQTTGPSSSASPYVLPTGPNASNYTTTSVLTVGDAIGGYQMVGLADGLGAFDNGNGTFTLLMNHELASGGAVRTHGGSGAFVSSWVIRKSDFAVLSGQDQIQSLLNQDGSPVTGSNLNISRLCSADLSASTAFYNSNTGLGSTARIFMSGEEGGPGRGFAHIVTGADAGKSYILSSFTGSGTTANAWENLVANPHEQDKTIVIGTNDGGGSAVNNKVGVYVGTKTNTGSEIDKAGLTNGTMKWVSVSGNSAEIVNSTTRATNISSGFSFTLTTAASATTFSRPEDGAWNPLDDSQFYFVTTDRLDTVSDGVGSQVGRSRLWRLNFADITDPDAGGTIDLLLDGTEGGNMFDNLTISADGHVWLQEDVGNAAHNGKIWDYNPFSDTLSLALYHDPARNGDIGVSATAPFNQDEEASGIIDISAIMGVNGTTEKWLLSTDQQHYSLASPLIEGGQLFAIHQTTPVPEPSTVWFAVGFVGLIVAVRARRACRA